MPDRTIHARTVNNTAIVRYDRAGKWYAERGSLRRRLALSEAVSMATKRGSHIYLGKPGGKLFDARVRSTVMERAR